MAHETMRHRSQLVDRTAHTETHWKDDWNLWEDVDEGQRVKEDMAYLNDGQGFPNKVLLPFKW